MKTPRSFLKPSAVLLLHAASCASRFAAAADGWCPRIIKHLGNVRVRESLSDKYTCASEYYHFILPFLNVYRLQGKVVGPELVVDAAVVVAEVGAANDHAEKLRVRRAAVKL
jgi:hypothetical protein